MAEPEVVQNLCILYFKNMADLWLFYGYIHSGYIALIDTEQYEAADMDGANRWQKMFFITLPSISSSIIVC